MSTYRFQFVRESGSKYTAHLDMLRTFQRAFRRAGLPIAYSQGFNPHPEFVMGLPLGIGITSNAEYCDVQMETDIDTEQMLTSMNQVLPESLKIVKVAKRLNNHNIMASISHLACIINFPDLAFSNEISHKLEQFILQQQIQVVKRTKKGEKLVDIKPQIHFLSANGLVLFTDEIVPEEIQQTANAVVCEDCGTSLFLLLDSGSQSNLNPDLLAKTLLEVFGEQFYTIHREKVYILNNDMPISPMSLAALS